MARMTDADATAKSSPNQGVLSHVNVLDLSWVAAGPLTGVLLAYFGATVVRCESAYRVDPARGTAPLAERKAGVNRSGYYNALNLGKLGVSVNLNTSAGREVIDRFVEWADVIIQAFTPGTTKRWGLDYATLQARKPEIIVVSLSLQGQTGPHAAMRGLGFQVHGMSGMASLIGWPDRGPTGFAHAYPDYVVPLPVVFATIAALDYRDRTGKGQEIDLAQMEGIIHATDTAIPDASVNGRIQERAGNQLMGGDLPRTAPHGVYPARGENRWIAIAVFSDGEWRALCDVLGQPQWVDDPRFATLEDRCQNADDLDALIAAQSVRFEEKELMASLQALGVAAGVVNDQQGLVEDPQLAARGHFRPLTHPEFGEYPSEVFGGRLSLTPPTVQRHAPLMSEHNEYVLRELLHFSEDDFTRLVAEGGVEFYGGA